MANNVDSPCNHPCNTKELKTAFEGADCRRITWDYQIYAVENELKIEKRIAIWARFDSSGEPVWKRLCVIVCDLDWAAYRLDKKTNKKKALTLSKSDQEKLKIVDNTIKFDGGFLEVKDPGLKALLDPLDIKLSNTSESKVLTDCADFKYETNEISARDEKQFTWAVSECIEPMLTGEQAWQAEIARNAEIDLQEVETGQILRQDLDKLDEKVTHLMPTGRNIHIEVDFREKAADDGGNDIDHSDDDRKQPLFYFPQNDTSGNFRNLGVVFLGTSAGRQISWTISNQYLVSDRFELESGENRHQVAVSQDYDWLDAQLEGKNEKPFFEMMVDSIGLGYATKISGHPDNMTALAKRAAVRRVNEAEAESPIDLEADHDFGTGPRKFWVGYVPAKAKQKFGGFPTKEIWKGWKGKVFKGTIKRIYFDPNSSCSSCG